jgi:hypothetical protein
MWGKRVTKPLWVVHNNHRSAVGIRQSRGCPGTTPPCVHKGIVSNHSK